MIEELLSEDARPAWKLVRGWTALGAFLLAGAIGVMTSIYKIPADSRGVVQRFGTHVRTAEPGIHAKIPFGIETLIKVPVTRIQKEEFGFRTLKSDINSQFLDYDTLTQKRVSEEDIGNFIQASGETDIPAGLSGDQLTEYAKEILKREYLMLTGDLNIADVEWVVQYRIKDPAAYLFNVREPKMLLRDTSQSILRALVGNGSIDEAITIGRVEYEAKMKDELQRVLNDYESGIDVVAVNLQSSNPPRKVRPAFNMVNEAMQKKETRINEAKKEYNDKVPKARGEAQRTIQEAEGYAIRRVNEAEGNVAKFKQLYQAYIENPDITRQRLYFETMEQILPRLKDVYIIEQKGAESGLLLKADILGGATK